MANLVGKVGSEESAQLSVWKLGVASCNFTTSVGEVGEVGSFEGRLGRETEEASQLLVWKLGVASCNFTTSIGEVGEVGKIGSFEGLGRETEEVSQLSVWKLLSFLQHAEELEFL